MQRLQFRDEDFSEVPDEGILGDLIHFNLMPEDMVRDPIFQKYFLPIYRADFVDVQQIYLQNKPKV